MLAQFEKDMIAKLDLSKWSAADSNQKKGIMEDLFAFARNVFSLKIKLSFTMPEGFEMAYGLSNPSTGDIHINEALWTSCESIEPLFFFLHEVRHSIQSSHPELFPQEYALNSRYIIQFDGTGYKVENGQITTVSLTGTQDYFTELYLASPCERDANAFAYRCLKAADAGERIDALYHMWSPEYRYFSEEHALDEFLKAAAEIERLAEKQL